MSIIFIIFFCPKIFPVLQMRNERAGIGSEDAIHSDDNNRGERWKRARARYDQIK